MRWLSILMLQCAVALSGCSTAPTEAISEATAPLSARRVELLFGGDLMVHTSQLKAAHTAAGYRFDSSFEALKPLFQRADFTILNLETTLSDRPPYTGYPLFRSPRELATTLRNIGVDVLCQANNHVLDGGALGVRRTTHTLDSCLLLRTGVFRDSVDWRRNRIVYLQHRGIRLALLNYTYGTNGLHVPRGMRINHLDTVQMTADLLAIDSTVDCRIVCLHWGDEYSRTPNAEQRRVASFLRRRGVELIIGHHPHVVQPFEADSLGAIFYSLGNLISNQRKRYCDGGILARIIIEKREDGRLHFASEALPIWVDKEQGYRIELLDTSDSLLLKPAARLFLDDTRRLLMSHRVMQP